MPPRTLRFKLLLAFIQAVLISNPHNVKADFSDSCVNSTTSTSCIHTAEQLYNSLAKSENSFKIESALYPAKRPSSVLVRVSIYGSTNKTSNSKPLKYLWSLSCLYAALPATLLELLSLGSILVAPRTQDLNIQIPLFCCNVSDKDSDRGMIIKGMIEGVLAALQDLAVSPGIRDPRLNTAECVMQGHKTNISATGLVHCTSITIMLWSSVGFSFVSCPLLAYFFEEYRKRAQERDTTEQQNSEDTSNGARRRNEKIFAQAVCTLCFWLAVIGSLMLFAAFVISIVYSCKGELRWDIPWTILSIFIESGLVFWWRKKNLGDKCYSLRFTICASVTSYLASWLLIGIVINPTWGLTVTLLLVFLLAAFAIARYKYLDATDNKGQTTFSCVCFVFAVIFLVLVVVLAGQAYYGRETADEALKTALMPVIVALVSWLFWKTNLLEAAGDSSTENGPSTNLEMEQKSLEANQSTGNQMVPHENRT